MLFQLSAVECNAYAREQIQWEGYFSCPDGAGACHISYDTLTHSTTPVGSHTHLIYGKIVYDSSTWSTLTDDMRRAESAHEMGHGLGLQDHSYGQCAALTIMGYTNRPPCYQEPTFWDAIAAMDTHGYFD